MDNVEATLRDDLTAAFDAAPEIDPAPSLAPAEEVGRARDEVGRFAPKESKEKELPTSTAQAAEPVKAATAPSSVEAPVAVEPNATQARLYPWKKDMWPILEKLDSGQALTPDEARRISPYITEREGQYAAGVSTYKSEVERLKPLDDAVAPFADDLRAHNLQPEQWIKQIGEVHQRLVRGSPEQKIQTLQWLANNYGVSLSAIQTGQVDPITSHLGPLQEQVRELQGKLQQQEKTQQDREMGSLQQEVSKFAETHQHYEAVRETMGQLLDSGVAKDLQSAYDKALRLNDEIWQSESLRLSNERAESDKKAQADKVARARSGAVSTRTATPGAMGGNGQTDLRGQIAEAFEAHTAGRV